MALYHRHPMRQYEIGILCKSTKITSSIRFLACVLCLRGFSAILKSSQTTNKHGTFHLKFRKSPSYTGQCKTGNGGFRVENRKESNWNKEA